VSFILIIFIFGHFIAREKLRCFLLFFICRLLLLLLNPGAIRNQLEQMDPIEWVWLAWRYCVACGGKSAIDMIIVMNNPTLFLLF
jgi:hypothetical protein